MGDGSDPPALTLVTPKKTSPYGYLHRWLRVCRVKSTGHFYTVQQTAFTTMVPSGHTQFCAELGICVKPHSTDGGMNSGNDALCTLCSREHLKKHPIVKAPVNKAS